MYCNLEIIDIINDFKNNCNVKNPVWFYTHGGCYQFCKILQKQIGGDIYYLPLYQHFILFYNHKFYDITGNVTYTYQNETLIKEEDILKRKKIMSGFY